ncbi:glycoside hydrolase family 78 protein [Luteolibacter arcticus]|uniref:alpha-L-rhamnosidase n=1 Tax=Luteolibacter arcticus TaxID=1581411 RepID=A0ABT3GQC6_9BACT|nr:alpha-L-rhamnosidase [Luteolibacter arcticus]MCW1925712.1 glycoside hydrolase family 78 protein [Luteolibacter arcticus]
MKYFYVLIALALPVAAELSPLELRCEYHQYPLAVCTPTPRFSWKVAPTDPAARDIRQAAYEIQVASESEGFEAKSLWSSGKVTSPATDQIVYAGETLASGDRASWRVRVWGAGSEASEWSPPASFSIGLLNPEDWSALWISAKNEQSFTTTENVQNFIGEPSRGKLVVTPAKYFRKEFQSAPVVRATVHATALGVYTLEINGQRVSDERLAPGWSAYQRRIHYQTYDVTKLLRDGKNAIGATLADGWYSGYVAYGLLTDQEGLVPGINGRYCYGVSTAVRVQLKLERADGSSETIITDPTWKASPGPITESDILMGESYDARKELTGWSAPGYDDSNWQSAVCKTGTDSKIEPHPGVPVRPIEQMTAKTVVEHKPGVFIFDLGQNISGVVRLKVKGKAGDKVTIRYAEVLHNDGRLSTENLRCARAVDTYILKGDPAGETWMPEFTYHGFQYVELTGFPGTAGLDAVTGIVIHSDTPLHGAFECSDPMLNKLYQNMVWTQRANFFEMPTDCPQRDERMGWTGDAQIFVRAATFNADIASFYTKWLRDLNDDAWDYGAYPAYAPRPLARPNEHHAAGWMDAGVICPWTIWQVYGDTRVISEHWRKMNDFMAWRATRDPELKGATDDCSFGDWLSVGNVKTPIPFIDLAYHAYDARLMAEMAAAIGKPGDAAKYQALAEKVTSAFRKIYLQEDGRLTIHNQSAYAIALFFDLIPSGESAAQLAGLIRENGNKMTTGFLGTRPLLPALSASGHHDLAGVLMQQREYPSWGYEVDNGATSIWERWNSYIKGSGVHEPSMNSFSHYAFGAVCEWMFADLAGIDRAAPGFDRVRIAPRPTGTITHAAASMETRHGRLGCSWKIEKGKFLAEVTVPPNTTADVVLPVKGEVSEGGSPATGRPGVRAANGNQLTLGSGTYQFSATL